MALNVKKGTIVQPGATGNGAIFLAANFDPKVIIMWAVAKAAVGTGVATDRKAFAFGCGTYRGSVVSQWSIASSWTNTDAATIDAAHGNWNDALLKMTDLGTATVDLEIDLVSMQSGASSQVTVNFVNLHTTASIIIHYLILGGSDLTDAIAWNGTHTQPAATQDFTVAGFGQPDLVLAGNAWEAPNIAVATTAALSMGWGNKAGEQIVQHFRDQDTAAVQAGLYQRSGRIIAQADNTEVMDYEGSLSAVGSWPTDGVQITWNTNIAGNGDMVGLLFLKGTFQSKIGTGTQPIAGTPPVNQDIGLTFTPVGVITCTGSQPPSTALQFTVTDGPNCLMGASDGATHGLSAILEDDANTSQMARQRLSTTNALEMFTNATGTVTVLAAAAPSFSTNNLRFIWSTVNATAREYCYVALGSAAGAPAPQPKPVVVSQAVSRMVTR